MTLYRLLSPPDQQRDLKKAAMGVAAWDLGDPTIPLTKKTSHLCYVIPTKDQVSDHRGGSD